MPNSLYYHTAVVLNLMSRNLVSNLRVLYNAYQVQLCGRFDVVLPVELRSVDIDPLPVRIRSRSRRCVLNCLYYSSSVEPDVAQPGAQSQRYICI